MIKEVVFRVVSSLFLQAICINEEGIVYTDFNLRLNTSMKETGLLKIEKI